MMPSRILRWAACPALMMAAAGAAAPPNPAASNMAGWNDKQMAKRLEAYAKLTTDDFARSATLHDDDLEPVATITTENGYRFKGGFGDTVRSDPFLRANIDKTTGAISFQLYVRLTYSGDDRRFTLINIATSAGPFSVTPTLNDHQVNCPYGVCVRQDDMAFAIPEPLIRRVADDAGLRPVVPWRFRLKSAAGLDFTDDIAPAEAAGLLIAISQWRAKAHR